MNRVLFSGLISQEKMVQVHPPAPRRNIGGMGLHRVVASLAMRISGGSITHILHQFYIMSLMDNTSKFLELMAYVSELPLSGKNVHFYGDFKYMSNTYVIAMICVLGGKPVSYEQRPIDLYIVPDDNCKVCTDHTINETALRTMVAAYFKTDISCVADIVTPKEANFKDLYQQVYPPLTI